MIDKYASRRIGTTCKVCKTRFHAIVKVNHKSVCDDCMQIMTPCPVCGKDMPKYKAKGGERVACSEPCRGKLKKRTAEHTERLRQSRNAHYDKVGRKSHKNKLARRKTVYALWRESVFKRDNYTCQECGARNEQGVGRTVVLHPHHIKPFATFPELRYEVTNGITLCKNCHRNKHKHVFIGRSKNRKEQPFAQLRLPIAE